MTDEEQLAMLLAGCMLASPADDAQITSAEAELGVRFPPSYRLSLRRYGDAVCQGFEIAGLFRPASGEEPPLWSDVVTTTLHMRRGSGGQIASGYVAIAGDGGDHMYYLDTGQVSGATDECPVVALGPGTDATVVAENFIDFVARRADGGL